MADLQMLVDQLAACDDEGIVTVLTSILQARPEVAPAVVNFAVPDLTYPPARALTERRSQGSVKSFNESKGFGFIDCPELKQVFGNDVFVHASQVPAGFTAGTPVSFAVALNKDSKPQAYDIHIGGGKGMGRKGSDGAAGGGACGGDWKSWGSSGKGGGKDWGAAVMQAAFNMMKGGGKKGGGGDSWGPGPTITPTGSKGASKGKMGSGGPRNSEIIAEAVVIGEYEGTIKSFSATTGYGFIDCPEVKADYGSDVFLHKQQIGSCSVGDTVTFELFLNGQGKPQAKSVSSSESGSAAKRPRIGF